MDPVEPDPEALVLKYLATVPTQLNALLSSNSFGREETAARIFFAAVTALGDAGLVFLIETRRIIARVDPIVLWRQLRRLDGPIPDWLEEEIRFLLGRRHCFIGTVVEREYRPEDGRPPSLKAEVRHPKFGIFIQEDGQRKRYRARAGDEVIIVRTRARFVSSWNGKNIALARFIPADPRNTHY